MKAVLEFNLPEDQHDFDFAVNGVKWMSFAHSFEQYLRSEWKYNGDAYTEEQYKVLEQIRKRFYEMLREENLEL